MKNLKKLTVLALASLVLAGCGGGNPSSQAPQSSAQPSSAAPSSAAPSSQAPSSQAPSSIDPTAPYEREDDADVYDRELGYFEELIAEAKAETDMDMRFVRFAEAEAALMDSGVMMPTYTRGGTYAMTRVAPRTVPNAMWGNDDDRLKGLLITEKGDGEHLFIKGEYRTELIELWDAARKGGAAYNPKAYLQEKGYSFADTYTTTFNSTPVTIDVLDTSKQRDTETLVNAIEGLLEYDNLGTLQPRLAKALPTLSADGKTYTFEIRDDAYWYTSQGRQYAQVTADDFVAGFQHMLDCQAGLEWLCEGVIKGVSEYVKGEVDFSEVGYRVNNGKLEIELVAPESFFLTRLTYSCFMPMNRAFYESKGGKFGEDFDKTAEDYQYGLVSDLSSMVYNSAFIPTSIVNNSIIQYDKNNEYYDADKVTLNQIKWVYDTGENAEATYATAINGIYAGIGLSLSNGLLKKAQDDGYFDAFHYVTDTDSTTFFCGFNVDRGTWEVGTVVSDQSDYQKNVNHAAMNNANFRRALQHAWDRETWNGVVTGAELATASLRNIYTAPEFVALGKDVEFEGHTFELGTTYGALVEYFLQNEFGRQAQTADGVDGWYNPELAADYLALAKDELGAAWDKVTIEIVCYSASKNQVAYARAFKESIEEALGEDNVEVVILNTDNLDDYYLCGYDAANGEAGNYDAFYGSGWGPDYGDPSTYLDTFLGDGQGYMTKVIGLF